MNTTSQSAPASSDAGHGAHGTSAAARPKWHIYIVHYGREVRDVGALGTAGGASQGCCKGGFEYQNKTVKSQLGIPVSSLCACATDLTADFNLFSGSLFVDMGSGNFILNTAGVSKL